MKFSNELEKVVNFNEALFMLLSARKLFISTPPLILLTLALVLYLYHHHHHHNNSTSSSSNNTSTTNQASNKNQASSKKSFKVSPSPAPAPASMRVNHSQRSYSNSNRNSNRNKTGGLEATEAAAVAAIESSQQQAEERASKTRAEAELEREAATVGAQEEAKSLRREESFIISSEINRSSESESKGELFEENKQHQTSLISEKEFQQQVQRPARSRQFVQQQPQQQQLDMTMNHEAHGNNYRQQNHFLPYSQKQEQIKSLPPSSSSNNNNNRTNERDDEDRISFKIEQETILNLNQNQNNKSSRNENEHEKKDRTSTILYNNNNRNTEREMNAENNNTNNNNKDDHVDDYQEDSNREQRKQLTQEEMNKFLQTQIDINLDRENVVLESRCSARVHIKINKKTRRAQLSSKQQVVSIDRKAAKTMRTQTDSAKIKLLSMIITIESFKDESTSTLAAISAPTRAGATLSSFSGSSESNNNKNNVAAINQVQQQTGQPVGGAIVSINGEAGEGRVVDDGFPPSGAGGSMGDQQDPGLITTTSSNNMDHNPVRLRANLTELYICFDQFGNLEARSVFKN